MLAGLRAIGVAPNPGANLIKAASRCDRALRATRMLIDETSTAKSEGDANPYRVSEEYS
jgi:hypothetical protein